MQIQTDDIEPDDSPEEATKDESDLIRLQSSMSMLQEDFNRERKMLNDQIAKLQAQVEANEMLKETIESEHAAKSAFETSILDSSFGLEAPDKPLPNPPAGQIPKEMTNERDSGNEQEEKIIVEVGKTEIQSVETAPQFEDNFNPTSFDRIQTDEPISTKSPSPVMEIKTLTSSSSSSSSSDDEKELKSNSPSTSTSQKTVKEIELGKAFESDEEKKDPFATNSVFDAFSASATVAAAPIASPIERKMSSDNEDKLYKLKSIIKQSTENLEKLQTDDEKSKEPILPQSSSSSSSSDDEVEPDASKEIANSDEQTAEEPQQTYSKPLIDVNDSVCETNVDIFEQDEEDEKNFEPEK